jgi:hypothetical protein
MNKILLTFLLLVFSIAMAASVYRWVENDVVHYSDQPVEGAEEIDIREIDTYESPLQPERYKQAETAVTETVTAEAYSRLEIIMPEHNSVVWATGGLMQVLVDIQPALQPGHKIILLLNDKPVEGAPVASTSINATGIIRGTHQLVAAVVDSENYELLSSDPIVIHVRAHSVHDPLRRQ